MKAGVTGTRRGCSPEQMKTLRECLRGVVVLHHGDCIGVDAEAHDICRELGEAFIIVHPPTVDRFRAYKRGNLILAPKPYGVRDHDIVNSVDLLLVVPKTDESILRSGTWATARYAKKTRAPFLVITQDGSIVSWEDTPI